MECCLCKGKIEVKGTWTEGNNAEPLKRGRCCDVCNVMLVIPARQGFFKEAIKKKKEEGKK